MSLSYPSRFVELQSATSHYDNKYPPDYEEATSTAALSDTSSIRPLNTGIPGSASTVPPGSAWPGSPSPFADPVVANHRLSPEHRHPNSHSRQFSVRRPLPSPRPVSAQGNSSTPPVAYNNTASQHPQPHGRSASISQVSLHHTGQSQTSGYGAANPSQSQYQNQNGHGQQQVPSYQSAVGHGQQQQPSQRQGSGGSDGYERWVYTYRLVAGGAPVQVLISVESSTGLPTLGAVYTFRLSMKVGGIERPMCDPVKKTLRVDPRALEFVVFMFPGKSSLPSGCLWSLRVWLRVNSVDHRLFGEDEVWVGKDPDFNAIGDASFARLKHQNGSSGNGGEGEMVYQLYVGRAPVSFGVKWTRIQGNLFKYSMEYEAGGVGGVIFEDVRLKLDVGPRSVGFLIFTVPSNSVPPGASHKLRVWIRTLVPPSSLVPSLDPSQPQQQNFTGLPFNDSYLYQRLYKTDDFKVGAHLQFESLGPKMIMAFSMGGPEVVGLAHAPHGGGGKGRKHSVSGSLGSVDEAGPDF